MAWYRSLVYFDIIYYIHTITCIQYIHLSPLADVPLRLLIAGQLSRKKASLACRRAWNRTALQLQQTEPTHYHLIWATSYPTAITICNGLSHPTGWAALLSKNISWRFFLSRAEKPSEDIAQRLFLMNMKGLIKDEHGIAKRLCPWVRRFHPNILLEQQGRTSVLMISWIEI